jgi:hypothetical protein
MKSSTAVLRRVEGPSRRALWQALALARRESRTQFFGRGEKPHAIEGSRARTRENPHAIFSPVQELTEQLAKADEKIVIFLDGQKYVVPRSKLLEWDSI